MKCKNAKPGIHGGGNGLYLRVWPSGSRSWIQRLVIQGKRTDLGLGSFPVVSLAEARGARWSEIDISARSWTMPADRTKTGEVHRVPLSDAAVAVLESARILDDGSDLVFPSSQKRGCQMTAHTLQKVLRETGFAGRTVVHGFRKSFRTWADDKTKADWAVKELCLGHAVGNKVERTYATSDLFERRRRLMEQWAAFATGERGKVVRMSA